MSTQPEALRLADALTENNWSAVDWKAAAELRRLHDLLGKANALARIRGERVAELETENKALRQANLDCVAHFEAIKAERDELLEALQKIAEIAKQYAGQYPTQVGTIADEAIAKATGEKQ